MTKRDTIIKFKGIKERRSSGYILLDRRFFDCDHLRGGDERDLFLRMVAEARFKDGRSIKRGQLFVTRDGIREWTRVESDQGFKGSIWTMASVRRFLNRQVKAKAITIESIRRGMIITILNYEKYQDRRNVISEVEPAQSGEVEPAEKTASGQDHSEISDDVPEVEPAQSREVEPAGENGREFSLENGNLRVFSNDSSGLEVEPAESCPNRLESLGIGDPISGGWAGTYILGNNEGKKDKKKEKDKKEKKDRENLTAMIVQAEVVVRDPDPGSVEVIRRGIPYQKILDLFLELCPTLPRARMTNNLKKQIRERWNESVEFQSLEFWREYFRDWVDTSEFLRGDSESGFKASIQWVTGPKNFSKILSGNFTNRVRRMPQPTTYSQMQDYEQRTQARDIEEILRRRREERENGIEQRDRRGDRSSVDENQSNIGGKEIDGGDR